MTRAAPAKILGLNDKGSLKEGSNADIAIYDPKKPIDKMFSSAEYVFKNGIEIVREGQILRHLKTSTNCLKLNYDRNIHKKIQNWFNNYYSLRLDEFEIDENFFEDGNFRKIN
jgi:formylmethanofuran dehydrogenase subunit A